MDYTQMLGNSNELKCITAFILLGFECSIPYGNGAKYDFIADDGEHLYRILCKCSNYVNAIRKWCKSYGLPSTKEEIKKII